MQPPLPWLYPYTVDEAAVRDGRDVLRPIVPIRVIGPHDEVYDVDALVDSGSDHVLVAPWLARALRIPTPEPGEDFLLGVGGERQWVRMATAGLVLRHPEADTGIGWEAPVGAVTHWPAWFGVLLGQRGFFDRFTVSFQRDVGALAIEGGEVFEQRFGSLITVDESRQWMTPHD